MKRRLKIGVTCYPTFGGSGVVAASVGMGLARLGHKVHFISYAVPRRVERFTEGVFFHEVELIENPVFLNPPYTLALASKIVDVASYHSLDVLHVHYAVPHATSAYLARQIMGDKAPKIITTLHGTDITLVGSERTYLPITRFSIMESDAVTAPSKFLKAATYDKLNIPTECGIDVISNFVDVEAFKPSEVPYEKRVRARLGVDASEKVLAHVSNFRPVKRVSDVVRVFAKIREEMAAKLLLVGDGPERANVEALVRELGLDRQVYFLGKQESTAEILQSADLFLLPSNNESFGLAALEAMACGVPVVASNAEGIPEVVMNGENGFLSGVGDIADMTRNALRILKDDELYKTISANARATATSRFAMESKLKDYESLYYRVLGI